MLKGRRMETRSVEARYLQQGRIWGVRGLPHRTQTQQKGKVGVSQQWGRFRGGEGPA